MLHERVGEIFLEEDEARAAFSDCLKRLLVPDGGTMRKALEVVLLLESPHTAEVRPPNIRDRHPLAGDAGAEVRDQLAACKLALPKQPIGQLVHRGDKTVLRLGLMNVSQLPFQRKPYADVRCTSANSWRDYLKCMNHIRKNPNVRSYQGFKNSNSTGRRLESELNQLNDAITTDLRGRLKNLQENNPCVQIVPCGEAAAAFYTKAMVSYLPHPARRANKNARIGKGWQTLNREEKMCLKDIAGCLDGT